MDNKLKVVPEKELNGNIRSVYVKSVNRQKDLVEKRGGGGNTRKAGEWDREQDGNC
jgi:hypothetical protein